MGRCWQLFIVTENSFSNLRRPGGHAEPMAGSRREITKVKTMDDADRKDLQLWFGLSYSAFCVMPRVFMEAMPAEWQEKMAKLLFEYDELIDQSVCGVHSCFVTAKNANNRFMKMPEELLNYRHPRQEFIQSFLREPT